MKRILEKVLKELEQTDSLYYSLCLIAKECLTEYEKDIFLDFMIKYNQNIIKGSYIVNSSGNEIKFLKDIIGGWYWNPCDKVIRIQFLKMQINLLDD